MIEFIQCKVKVVNELVFDMGGAWFCISGRAHKLPVVAPAQEGPWAGLPCELVVHISRLGGDGLLLRLRMMTVCRAWRAALLPCHEQWLHTLNAALCSDLDFWTKKDVPSEHAAVLQAFSGMDAAGLACLCAQPHILRRVRRHMCHFLMCWVGSDDPRGMQLALACSRMSSAARRAAPKLLREVAWQGQQPGLLAYLASIVSANAIRQAFLAAAMNSAAGLRQLWGLNAKACVPALKAAFKLVPNTRQESEIFRFLAWAVGNACAVGLTKLPVISAWSLLKIGVLRNLQADSRIHLVVLMNALPMYSARVFSDSDFEFPET